MAARRIEKSRFAGNRNSAEECDTASKPTNAHGIMARMRSTCVTFAPPSGTKAGAIAASPPSCRESATKKVTATAASMNAANAACTRPASRRP